MSSALDNRQGRGLQRATITNLRRWASTHAKREGIAVVERRDVIVRAQDLGFAYPAE